LSVESRFAFDAAYHGASASRGAAFQCASVPALPEWSAMGERLAGLYVIVDPEQCAGRDPVEVARLALDGGASMLQWRDKSGSGRREKGDQLEPARAIRELCAEHRALFIVNDHADLALAVGADGVHLGQHDLPPESVRAFVPRDSIVGVSTNNVDEARRAEANGASYIAIGAIYPTSSKEPARTRAASLDVLRDVKGAVRVPVVAIGGINASNIDGVIAAGADAVAVISAVCGAEDVRGGARELSGRFDGRS
jgi:thiamine-phosphate pyrophosphorylase